LRMLFVQLRIAGRGKCWRGETTGEKLGPRGNVTEIVFFT